MSKLKAAALLGALVFVPGLVPAAHADDTPWCAYAGGRGSYENCGFYTLAQCRAAVSGVGGDCRPNPYYQGGPSYDIEPPPYDAYPRRRRAPRY